MKNLFAKIAILTLAFAGLGAVAHPASSATIEVAASNWKFAPSAITLHVGETTRVHFTATGGVHGIKSDDLGIPLTGLRIIAEGVETEAQAIHLREIGCQQFQGFLYGRPLPKNKILARFKRPARA